MADLEVSEFDLSTSETNVRADFTVQNNTSETIETQITFDSEVGDPDDFGSATISPGEPDASWNLGDFLPDGEEATVDLNADGYGTLASETVSREPAPPDLVADSFSLEPKPAGFNTDFVLTNNTDSTINTEIAFVADDGSFTESFGSATIDSGSNNASYSAERVLPEGGTVTVNLNADRYGTLASESVAIPSDPDLEVTTFSLSASDGSASANFTIVNNTDSTINTEIAFVADDGSFTESFGSAIISPGENEASYNFDEVLPDGGTVTVNLNADGYGTLASESVTIPTDPDDESMLVLESIDLTSAPPDELSGEVVIGNEITSGDGEDITTELRLESPDGSFSYTHGEVTVTAYEVGSDPTVVEIDGVSGLPTDTSDLRVCAVVDDGGELGCDTVDVPSADFRIVDIAAPDVIDPEEYPAAFDV